MKGTVKSIYKGDKKKGRIAANKVWELGERICKDDFIRRWILFKYLVQSVMSYRVEIWKWEEKKRNWKKF